MSDTGEQVELLVRTLASSASVFEPLVRVSGRLRPVDALRAAGPRNIVFAICSAI